jgi:hypothetical protein
MGRTACTEPQCLYSRAVPLLPLSAVRPVQSLSACTRVHFTFTVSKASISVYSGLLGYELGAPGRAIEALSYKPKGRGLNSRSGNHYTVIELNLPIKSTDRLN